MIRPIKKDLKLKKTEKQNESKPSFYEVYQKHHRAVRSVVFHIIGTHQLDDVVQDVFVKVFKKLDQFQQQSSLFTWIYRISVNTALDACKRKKLSFGDIDPDQIEIMETSQTEINQNIQNTMKELSSKERSIISLFYIQGFKLEEIATILDIPLGTAKSRLFTARKHFRKNYQSLLRDGDTL